MSELIVEVVRSGFVESVHRARVFAVDASGAPVMRHGDTDVLVSPRSSMKPLQALGMVWSGLPLENELLALACASHAGEDFHVEGARKILAEAGLDESALGCPEALPEDTAARHRAIRAYVEPGRIFMNCSGKHAAMLATCVVNGWPVESYLDPGHPLQRAIRAAVEEFTGERVAATGVDGCGAPLFFVSMEGVVRAFRRLTLAGEGTPERRIADAMRAHPEWTSGTERPEAKLMRAMPGLMVKAGAEAFDAFAFADGRAAAVKIEDGGARARVPVTVAALRALGLDAPEFAELAAAPLLGGGREVGEIRVRRP
ncbi:asparaginase [Microtetraspora sp. AC03309]|uniref:asparaginase n=1 Tax=Microtetraspora sp. AC03309 TaxID=2779376 RepID=UPI001E3038D6|nr:asparaginase [Microtetraspora sp. AC03309]MCC5579668.1 asparaginase [Microtetraspora sp. AC03309]